MLNAACALALALCVAAALIAGGAIWLRGLRRLQDAQAALRASEARAQAANQAKNAFLASVSHEFRTPLTEIRGYAELLQQRSTTEREREQSRLILASAEQLAGLVNEILDCASLESDSMTLLPTQVQLRPLVFDLVRRFGPIAESKALDLTVRIEPDVPQYLHCDGSRLRQILVNLLENAVKFTREGRVAVSVAVAGESVRFDVADSGPGIPEQAAEKVFQRFEQATPRTSREHGGLGLGLALSRRLAGRMGGSLTLRSAVGEGSCFTLALPIARAA